MLKGIVSILLIAITFTSCSRKMQDPQFNGITNFKVDKLGFPQSTVVVTLNFTNPNPFKGKLSSAEGDAFVDSLKLGHFFVDTTIDIPANSQFNVPVKLKVNLPEMLENLKALEVNDNVLIRLQGTGRAGRSGVFRNFKINYSGKQSVSSLIKM